MPTDLVRDHFSDDEIPDMLRKLNFCYDPPFQWQSRKARKAHQDLFGDAVRPGERYFRLRMGGSYANDLKLSPHSMERFLFALFAPRPRWEKQAERQIDQAMADVRSIMDRLRP